MFFRSGNGFHHHSAFHLVLLGILVLLVVAGVIALVRKWRPSRADVVDDAWRPPVGQWAAPTAPVDPALGELRLRYARGELSWEEYRQRAANLGYPLPDAGPDAPGEGPPPVP
jgi:hypothetical protein